MHHIPLWRKVAITASFGLILGIVVLLTLPFLSSHQTLLVQVQNAHDRAFAWLVANYIPQTQLFTYLVHPQTGEYPLENNAIRQLMTSRALAVRAFASEDLLEIHAQNLNHILDEWYVVDERGGYVLFNNIGKLGATAMLLRTLTASPLYAQHTDTAEALVQRILDQQQSDGSFRAWIVAPPYPTDEAYYLTFYSGEALLALSEYYTQTRDDTVYDALVRGIDFYLDAYVTNIDEHYYPAYVPWHTMTLSSFYEHNPDPRYTKAIFILTDRLLEMLDTDIVRGRFYNPDTPEFGRPHAASDGVYTEGLAYAYEHALDVGDYERASIYRDALVLATQNLINLQYADDESSHILPSYTYAGGLRTSLTDPFIRVDNTQHALDAFQKILTLPLD